MALPPPGLLTLWRIFDPANPTRTDANERRAQITTICELPVTPSFGCGQERQRVKVCLRESGIFLGRTLGLILQLQ